VSISKTFPAQISTNIATNIANNLARSAKYRHYYYFVAVPHTNGDSADPSPKNAQIRFATDPPS
jgi:hypothetical protein